MGKGQPSPGQRAPQHGAHERAGSLASLATVISQQGGNISNIHLTDRSPDFFRFELDLEVNDVEHMRAIIAVLQANKYVESVERANST